MSDVEELFDEQADEQRKLIDRLQRKIAKMLSPPKNAVSPCSKCTISSVQVSLAGGRCFSPMASVFESPSITRRALMLEPV